MWVARFDGNLGSIFVTMLYHYCTFVLAGRKRTIDVDPSVTAKRPKHAIGMKAAADQSEYNIIMMHGTK